MQYTAAEFSELIKVGGESLRNADLSHADLSYADLSKADLKNADLVGADLREADLRNAYLQGADLLLANLTDANLDGANLTGVNLSFANLRGARLVNADLTAADLRFADLTNAFLIAADLLGADLTGATLIDADLTLANLSEANLSGAIFLPPTLKSEESIVKTKTVVAIRLTIGEYYDSALITIRDSESRWHSRTYRVTDASVNRILRQCDPTRYTVSRNLIPSPINGDAEFTIIIRVKESLVIRVKGTR